MRCTKFDRKGRRRGFANLEFILSLPLMIAVVSGIVMGGYVVMNRVIVAQTVRRDAWTQRHGVPPDGSLPMQSGSPIGILPGVPAELGEISVEHTRKIQLPRYLPERATSSTTSHAVMGGAWDFQTIPFRPLPALQPEPRMCVYSPGISPELIQSMCNAFELLGVPF